MNKRTICTMALGGAVLPMFGGIIGAGSASAAEDRPGDAAQAISAVAATGTTAAASFLDAADGNGPTGADGLETEFPVPDGRWLGGPASGLLDGPFD